MKFNEKLQELRREKHYSQEELADKMGVSRQAVSKWESGTSYPEMDKLLLICKIFDVTLEELTSEKVTVDEIKEKGDIKSNPVIKELLEVLSRTHELFSRLGFGKCLGLLMKLAILGFIAFIIIRIPVEAITKLGCNFFIQLGNIGNILSSLWIFIIGVLSIVLFIIVLFYIYKTTVLDKYELVDLEEESIKEEIQVKKEELAPRVKEEPKERNSTFPNIFNFLGHIFTFIGKVIIFSILIFFICMFVTFIICTTIDVYLMIRGVVYIGIFLILISGVLFNGIFIVLFAHLLASKKINVKPILISFVLSLVLFGISAGISTLEVTELNFKNEAPQAEITEKNEIIEYKKDFRIQHHGADLEYVKDNGIKDNKIYITIKYYGEYNTLETYNTDDVYYIYQQEIVNNKKLTDLIINDLKNKSFYNYTKLFYEPKLIVKANSKVIDLLIKNAENYYQTQEEKEELENRINSLEEKIYDLEFEKQTLLEKIDDLNGEKEGYKEEIEALEKKIENLRKKLSNIEDSLND